MTDPERSWQIAREQLRAEMPPAVFDAWVKDTRFICLEDGIFTVGTPSAEGRDWLEGRLTSTIQRQLTGLLGEAVAVQFVHAPAAPPQGSSRQALDEHMLFSIQRGLLSAFTRPDTGTKFPT